MGTKKPLFELDVPGNKLVFDNIYVNGLHVLRKVNFTSICQNRILIKFRSNINGIKVNFQLSNENFVDSEVQVSFLFFFFFW